MALKEDWKGTGKRLGEAFSGLGKTLIKTAKIGVDKADAWVDGKDPAEAVPQKNVTNDGSWRETGRDLSGAFLDLGRTLIHTAEAGVEKVEARNAEKAAPEQDPDQENR